MYRLEYYGRTSGTVFATDTVATKREANAIAKQYANAELMAVRIVEVSNA